MPAFIKSALNKLKTVDFPERLIPVKIFTNGLLRKLLSWFVYVGLTIIIYGYRHKYSNNI